MMKKANRNEIIEEILQHSDEEKERFTIDPKTNKVIEMDHTDPNSEEYTQRSNLIELNHVVDSIQERVK